jgi:glycosyltransferase involved in cell wall biosynthesis
VPDPKFSILLPTHNRPDVLPFAIQSVLIQTAQDFELVVAGDGCTDETADIVKGFNDRRIIWLDLPKAPNFGYANRNIALSRTRGGYIAYIGDDDLWLPDHLELLRPYFQEPGVDLVYSRPLWVVPGGMIAPGTFNLEHGPTLKRFLAKEQNGIPSGCVVHRRACFGKYGYWNDALPASGDWDMWARIIEGGGGKNFAYVGVPTCLHFRASWRAEAVVIQQLGVDWQAFRDLGEAIPVALKIPGTGGATEQQVVWQGMSADPGEWTRRARAAIWHTLNLRISTSDEQIPALTQRRAVLIDEISRLAHLNTELVARAAELADVKSRSARKIALLLRRIRLLIAPPKSQMEKAWYFFRGFLRKFIGKGIS